MKHTYCCRYAISRSCFSRPHRKKILDMFGASLHPPAMLVYGDQTLGLICSGRAGPARTHLLEIICLLEQSDAVPCTGESNGGGEAGYAPADDDKVKYEECSAALKNQCWWAI